MSCFFLAMTLFPEVQLKAQEEIDRIVGTKRLPNVEDRANLPYVDAIVKEVLRWHPVGPIGLPHMTTEDDIFDGYLIPKGALILANIWYASIFYSLLLSVPLNFRSTEANFDASNRAINHDPKVYHDPSVFKPERFLNSPEHEAEPDPHNVSFGFGRRICPGRVLADSAIYLTVAQSLAVFTVSKAVENGKEIEPVVQFSPGIISHPAPYQTSIKPRSPEHEALVRAVEMEHPWEEGDAKYL
jgi:cytochrome P450